VGAAAQRRTPHWHRSHPDEIGVRKKSSTADTYCPYVNGAIIMARTDLREGEHGLDEQRAPEDDRVVA
jgi:hypothetical protein